MLLGEFTSTSPFDLRFSNQTHSYYRRSLQWHGDPYKNSNTTRIRHIPEGTSPSVRSLGCAGWPPNSQIGPAVLLTAFKQCLLNSLSSFSTDGLWAFMTGLGGEWISRSYSLSCLASRVYYFSSRVVGRLGILGTKLFRIDIAVTWCFGISLTQA